MRGAGLGKYGILLRGNVGVQQEMTHRQQITNNPTSPGRAISYWISPCVPQENTSSFIESGKLVLVGATGKEHLPEGCAAAGMHTHTPEGSTHSPPSLPWIPSSCTPNTPCNWNTILQRAESGDSDEDTEPPWKVQGKS